MPNGPQVKKWTWLLDNVEVRGSIDSADKVAEEDGRTVKGDSFKVLVHEAVRNYRHLVAYVPGSHFRIFCETYREHVDDSRYTNRPEGWPIPTKLADDPFEVLDPRTNQRRPLKIGDPVRIKGRWVIENHHPDPDNRLVIFGWVFVELHPFDWQNIILDVPLPGETTTVETTTVETVSVAAPLYWGVNPSAYHWPHTNIAIGDQGGLFDNTVTANAHIKAPPLPIGHPPRADLVKFDEQVDEQVIINGTGLPLDQVRQIRVVDDGIVVTATAYAPLTQWAENVRIPDFNNPAHNRSVFQARYSVRWREIPPYSPPKALRLSVDPTPTPLQRTVTVTVHAVDAQTGALVNGTVTVRNPGQQQPDQYPTNTPFDRRFRVNTNPRTGEIRYPSGSVKAPGYPDARIPFKFPQVDPT